LQQFLQAGLVDEFQLHVAPLLLGAGVPLFDGMRGRRERTADRLTRCRASRLRGCRQPVGLDRRPAEDGGALALRRV
jgi:riboflavin biosynthesis pyrimidine reductase